MNTRMLPVKWVFKRKYDAFGFQKKIKARLCELCVMTSYVLPLRMPCRYEKCSIRRTRARIYMRGCPKFAGRQYCPYMRIGFEVEACSSSSSIHICNRPLD